MVGNFIAVKIWQNWWLTKIRQNFTIQISTHLYEHTSIVKSHMSVILPLLLKNIEQIEDIFLGTCPTTCRVPSIIFLIVTACRLFEFPVFHLQCKSPYAELYAKGLAIPYRLIVMVASNHQIYIKHVSCHLTFSSLTIKLSEIV